MGIVIKNPDIEKRAEKLAAVIGVSAENAIDALLKDALGEIVFNNDVRAKLRKARTEAIVQRYSSLPVYDTRTEEEILGYNEHGLPE